MSKLKSPRQTSHATIPLNRRLLLPFKTFRLVLCTKDVSIVTQANANLISQLPQDKNIITQ